MPTRVCLGSTSAAREKAVSQLFDFSVSHVGSHAHACARGRLRVCVWGGVDVPRR